jgi:hypothetical protein
MRVSLCAALAVGALAALGLAGCNSMRFEVGSGRVSRVEHHRKMFYLWGLVPDKRVDVRAHCPQGAVTIEEETEFLDWLLGFVTFGIVSPRSSTYHCAEGGSR